MYLFERVLYRIRDMFRRKPPKNFSLDVETLHSVQFIAEQSRRTPEEIAGLLIDEALRSREAQEDSWMRWQSLTPREQETTALICLNYTTRQVASKLHISPETVKTHVEHVLQKFGVPNRHALRMLLQDWDFSAWDR
jgi:DNA-binding CsgD family transcriptional regulator